MQWLLSLTRQKFDWLLLLAAMMLTCVGLTTIYSVDLSRGGELNFFSTQAVSFGLALTALFIAAFIHYSFFESGAGTAYLFSLILLVLVLVPGVGTIVNGTRGWFRVAGFSFQPAELAKAALIIFLAWRIERQGRRFEKSQFVLATGALAAFLIGLIMLQPDLGSGSVLAGIWVGLLVLTKTPKKYLVILTLIGVTGMAVGWFGFFQQYQKDRILTFINPDHDPLGAGYNVRQSMIAVGSGSMFGRGLGFGSQSQLHFLPEAQTDFIVSVIGEELGFVGLAGMLVLYGILLWRLVVIAQAARSDFAAYTVLGIALLFFIQLIVNTGAAFGILPVTGVTLPFVSYGGSSLIINYGLVGLAQSIARSTWA